MKQQDRQNDENKNQSNKPTPGSAHSYGEQKGSQGETGGTYGSTTGPIEGSYNSKGVMNP